MLGATPRRTLAIRAAADKNHRELKARSQHEPTMAVRPTSNELHAQLRLEPPRLEVHRPSHPPLSSTLSKRCLAVYWEAQRSPTYRRPALANRRLRDRPAGPGRRYSARGASPLRFKHWVHKAARRHEMRKTSAENAPRLPPSKLVTRKKPLKRGLPDPARRNTPRYIYLNVAWTG